MTTQTSRISLTKASLSDPFSTADIAANWDKIDRYPGTYPCTAGTRPNTWGAQHAGMIISETDTGLFWRWTGSEFRRVSGSGLLKTSAGEPAKGTRSTQFSTNSNTLQVVTAIQNVVVPDGHRPIQITANYFQADSNDGRAVAAIMRSATNNLGPEEYRWAVDGRTFPVIFIDNVGGGQSVTVEIPAGLDAGTYSWSLQYASQNNGVQSVMRGTSTITVKEL